LSVQENIKELSSLKYLVGMRFHAALVAAKAGVKVLGINYDIKVSNLSKNVGFPIIGLKQDDFTNEFNQLLELNTQEYKIPEFEFPYF
jgi:polysaccharide pyruvyl transferase WcaK-like protein